MPLVIRKATPDDANALYELYVNHLMTTTMPGEPKDMSMWQAQIAVFNNDPFYHVLIGEINGQIVSSVSVFIVEGFTQEKKSCAIIENMVTHTDHRRRGYITALMKSAGEIADAHACDKILLMFRGKRGVQFAVLRRWWNID